MVGDDRLGAVASPPVVALGDVLQDAEQVDALSGSGGGDLVEVGERRDVGDLVERELPSFASVAPSGGESRSGITTAA